MAEKEQEATIELNKKSLNFAGRDALLGATFSFITVIFTLCIGTYLVMNNKDVAGIGTLIVGVGTIVTIFMNSKKKEKD